jgi:Zn finger protein HypA/HybF involved in hydrogenase expression
MEAYCLKCRTKREMQGEKQITMKNGKPATQGTCPVCGTKMFKIGGGAAATAKAGAKK